MLCFQNFPVPISQMLYPLLKYVRGEVLSPDHWHELFRMLGLPRGTTLEKLTFGDIVAVSDAILSMCAPKVFV